MEGKRCDRVPPSSPIPATMALMKIQRSSKKLDFDSCSEEELPRSSSPERDNRKKLIFDFFCDDGLDQDVSDTPSSPPFKKVSLANSGLSPIEQRLHLSSDRLRVGSSLMEMKEFNTSGAESISDKFSPCRTRSGRIYTSVEKKRGTPNNTSISSIKGNKSDIISSASKLPTPVFIDNPRSSSRHNSGASAGIATPRSTRIQTSHLRVQQVELNHLQRDLMPEMMDFEEPTCNEPPPLNYSKRPMSRLLHVSVDHQTNHTPQPYGDKGTQSPWLLKTPANLHSPPTNEVNAMRLFDHSPTVVSSPVAAYTVPKHGMTKSRLFFGEGFDEPNHMRRTSAPAGLRVTFNGQTENDMVKERKRKRVGNINPFTPTSMLASLKKRFKSEPVLNQLSNSYVANTIGDDIGNHFSGHDDIGNDNGLNPAKRLRVSDIDISRYEEEFIEIKEIASGSFGKVKIARHRLDGMVYAIKVSRNKIVCNTHEERVAMNEVFAHSALMKHKHVVRYYNSWVENGHVYIQNEYCEGGSLANLIKEYRRMGRRFPESELKRILLHIAKGLQYIHSKQLVHLDVKPENIFISLDQLTPCPIPNSSKDGAPIAGAASKLANGANGVSGKCQSKHIVDPTKMRSVLEHGDCSGNESTDSGHASGCDARFYTENHLSSTGLDDRISYKIGDLGHVAPIYGEHIPEEGDCRYMAPELLADDVDRDKLPKADIFSLGLTLYEAASLQELPKNSLEDSTYERIKSGDLPFVEGYSKEFNQLIKSMVSKDEKLRPSASKIVTHPFLRSNVMSKSRSQLYKELKETKARIRQLELELETKDNPMSATWRPAAFTQNSPLKQTEEASSPQTSPVPRTPAAALANFSKAEKSKRLLVGRGTPKSFSCLL